MGIGHSNRDQARRYQAIRMGCCSVVAWVAETRVQGAVMARIRTIKPEFPQSESTWRERYFKKKAVTAQERRDIASRYGFQAGGSITASCIYCGSAGRINWIKQDRGAGWIQFIGLEIEHKLPEFQGGKGGENLDLACRPCNRAKGPRTVEQWKG